MEYTISLHDLFAIIKRGWKTAILIALIFAVLGAGYYGYSARHSNTVSAEELQQNAADIEAFENWQSAKEDVMKSLQEQLMQAYKRIEESPIMQINAYQCTYHKICIALDEANDASRKDLIGAWLTEEYGDPNTAEAKYLFLLDEAPGETDILIFDNGSYDLDAAAEDIQGFVLKKAEEQHLPVLATAEMRINGYSSRLFIAQDEMRNNVLKLQTELVNYTNNSLQAPAKMHAGGMSKRGLVKYALMGLIGGLILGLAFAVYCVVRKGTLLSSEQIRGAFGLKEIGTYKANDKESVGLLSATIDAVTDGDQCIMLFSDAAPEMCENLAEALNKEARQEFLCASGLKEDVAGAEAMGTADSVVIPLRCGKSTMKEVQTSIQWAQRFKKEVLGFILLEG